MKDKYLLVAGLPRSGSTLLQSVLNKSDQTYTLPETHFFEETKKRSFSPVITTENAIELLSAIASKWGIHVEQVLEFLNQQPDQQHSCLGIYFRIIEQYRPESDIPHSRLIPVEKTPGHLFSMAHILENSDNVKIILTVRNARDFANSIKNQSWSPGSIKGITTLWNESMLVVEQLKREFPERVHVTHYEQMISNPSECFQNIYRFSKLRWSELYLENINENNSEFISPDEIQWKSNNVNHPSIMATVTGKVTLSFTQRIQIFINTIFVAFRTGNLKYQRF